MKSSIQNYKNLRCLCYGRLPAQLIIQYTNQCNANCPQCGMRRTGKISRTTLDIEHVMQLIDSAAKKGITFLSFTGGEPLLFLDDIIKLVNHANSAGIPYVRTGTNGFLFRNSDDPGFYDKISRMAEKIASTNLYTFWISLDSANPIDHEKMRGLDGVVRGIKKAIPIFHAYGIYPSVNLGINRAIGGCDTQPFLDKMAPEEFQNHFQSAFEQFYQFIYDLGFTIVNACYPMSSGDCATDQSFFPESINTVIYGATSTDSIINFSREEKALIFKALFETIPKFRGKLRIFSPRCSLHNLIQKYTDRKTPLFPCRGGIDYFFVECENGMIHPCGYRDEPKIRLPDFGQRLKRMRECNKCDWECFRDPSDILGPFAELFSQPFTLLGKMTRNPQFFRLLRQDLSYYRACGFFNGRLAPQFQAMRRFEAH
jgi:MoaA/NifB/PqqE/SkfB family radical SAM enzyme